MMKRVLLIAMTIFTIGSTGVAAPKAGVIKIGALFHLTGEWAPQGNAFLEGAQLAVAEVNGRGGVAGKQIDLIVEDTKYIPSVTHSASKKLLGTDRIDVALVTCLTETRVAAPLFGQQHVPLITLWDSAPELEQLGRYSFAIGTWAPSSGEVAAKYAASTLKAKTAVVLNSNTGWSLSVSTPFITAFESLGGVVLNTITSNPKEHDYRSILLRVKKLKPDVIYAPVDGNLVPFYLQAKQLQITVPIISSDVIGAEHIANATNAFEGIYQTQSADPHTPEAKQVLEIYKKRFDKEAAFPLFTAWGWDGVMLIADAVEAGARTSEEITEALYEVRNYQGASGPISINAFGSSRMEVNMFQVRKGRFVRAD
ncbi:ABC transporter substrate-binding protein [Oligoflexia bacterium]|nr:ABC transporter substrate-binding protein [Oligoflexia bacterium]